MASLKRLKSVCQSIGHHAVSALSFIHPHLSRACKKARLETVEINLLDIEPYPDKVEKTEPLEKSLLGLKEKFEKILTSEGFTIQDITEIKLEFRFPPKYRDEYSCDCFVSLIHKSGKSFSRGLNYVGRTIPIN